MLLFRIFIKSRNQRSPYMPQINTGSCNRTGKIHFPAIIVTLCQFMFRWKFLFQIPPIWKSIGYPPFHIGLPDIREGETFKTMLFMPKHSSLKINKCLKFRSILSRKNHSVAIKILCPPSAPGTFRHSQHIRIKIILTNIFLFICH